MNHPASIQLWNGVPGELVPRHESVASPAPRRGTSSPGTPFHAAASLIANAYHATSEEVR